MHIWKVQKAEAPSGEKKNLLHSDHSFELVLIVRPSPCLASLGAAFVCNTLNQRLSSHDLLLGLQLCLNKSAYCLIVKHIKLEPIEVRGN